MSTVWNRLRQQTGKHPVLRVLLAVGVSGLTLSAVLVAAHMALLGQLVAGLAVVPLTFAVYLSRLLAETRPGGNGGGGYSGDDGEPTPPRPRTPGDGVDWERFEREYWSYVDDRVLVS
jgi:hypothetical protein